MPPTLSYAPNRRRYADHRATTPTRPSPLRHASTIPTTPDDDEAILPSSKSITHPAISSPTRRRTSAQQSPKRRISLGELQQAPSPRPATPVAEPIKQRSEIEDAMSVGISTAGFKDAPSPNRHHTRQQDPKEPLSPSAPLLNTADLDKLSRSATKELRTLSKLAENGGKEEFTISGIQRNLSKKVRKPDSTPGYGGRTWMDTERQYRQAYEYLCHIGEAKEWIEHVMDKPIPPIVQLEESLRDGVTLAEVVQAFHPEKRLRIFRHAKLQFRHSDNIVLFFQFLAEVELPELFRFELVDLYEKKNIPKVIYCIHALSWLLLGKGIVDFRMGNLVGRLQFEKHELESKQKELDKAGVSMPNFSGMGERFGAQVEAPPEPIETEEERTRRELKGHHTTIADLQAQVRGALVRLRLGNTMYSLYQEEPSIADLQSRVRAIMARQSHQYLLERHQFAARIQSYARGFMIRSRMANTQGYWHQNSAQVVLIQSLFRGRKARKAAAAQRASKAHFWKTHTPQVIRVQSFVRKRAAKREAERLKAEYQLFSCTHLKDVVFIQSLARRRHACQHADMLRKKRHAFWTSHEDKVVTVQNLIRRRLATKHVQDIRSEREAYWASHLPQVVLAQSAVRRRAIVKSTRVIKATLLRHKGDVVEIQAAMRGALIRKRLCQQLDDLEEVEASIIDVQAALRARALRDHLREITEDLDKHENAVVDLQSQIRAMLRRNAVGDQLEALQDCEDEITILQASIRGHTVRERYLKKQQHYQENIKKVIKLQSFARMKQQGQAYKSLTTGKNPPVSTIKNFVHLLNDSDFDFDQELESEKVQQTVVQQVKKVEEVEDWIAEVDMKIGLLAHTKIHSDEIAKLKRQMNANFAGLSRKSTNVKGAGGSASLNREARAKLERYQELFFILQTQPQYLARLFRRTRANGASELDCKKLESLVMSTFGFAQKRRDEFFLLKTIRRSILEEVNSCGSLGDFSRSNFLFSKIFTAYTRVPRDRKFIQQVLRPIVKTEIADNEQLDLESDPLQIYRTIVNNEELRQGYNAAPRKQIASREEAIREDAVRTIFVSHLQDIRDLVDQFLLVIKEKILAMPYGTRYITQQMFELLRARFPLEQEGHLLQVVGHWVWKIYVRPALLDPEGFGLLDNGIDDDQRRNISVLAKVLNQAASARLFDNEDVYLQPMNRYLEDNAIPDLQAVWHIMVQVDDIETIFDMTEQDDFYAKVKPTLFIKTADMTAMHALLTTELPSICVGHEDSVLAEIIRGLGNPVINATEMQIGPAEITLTLGGKMHAVEDPDAKLKALLIETKRCVLYIIRVQTGASLMDVMVKPITEEDCDRWDAIIREELALNDRKQNAYADSANNLIDIASLPYEELKRTALENILVLEKQGRLTRTNNYQDLLNEIAVDIRTKHRRRLQRQKELETARMTSKHLEDKLHYQQETLKAYNNTFEQGVKHLQEKGKDANRGAFVVPFTKQWFHQKELERMNKKPTFGSWKRSAEHFATKGVVLGWDGHDLRQDDLTISSDRVNEFVLEGGRGSTMIPGAVATYTWDDLLTAEYEGKEVLEFFGRTAHGGMDGATPVQGVRGGVGFGAEAGVLRLSRKMLMLWLSKKFLGSV